MIMKSVNYASTKPASNTQTIPKESEPSDEDTDDVSGEQNGAVLHQGKSVHFRTQEPDIILIPR
jgi:hypothetical protein